jgi:hypothetical protein
LLKGVSRFGLDSVCIHDKCYSNPTPARSSKTVKETRKAAETTVWWLFGTAITSVAVAAFAGVLAELSSK